MAAIFPILFEFYRHSLLISCKISKEVENQYACHDLSVWNKRQKFTFAPDFPPKHNLPVRENNSLEQAKVKVACCLPKPLSYTILGQLIIITDQSGIVCCCCCCCCCCWCCCCCCCFNLIFALFLFLFISRHYLKKVSMDPVHESGPWPGPKCGSMFCPHPLKLIFCHVLSWFNLLERIQDPVSVICEFLSRINLWVFE